MMLLQLVAAFFQVGLFSFGGGYAAVPLIQSQAVANYGWLTLGEFTDLVTIAEMTPGPIAINAATFVGARMAGIPGALAATGACILAPVAIVTLLSGLYMRYRNAYGMKSVLACLRPAVVALIGSAALSMLSVALYPGGAFGEGALSWAGAALFAAALAVLRLRKKTNPILVMAACGLAGVALYALGLQPL